MRTFTHSPRLPLAALLGLVALPACVEEVTLPEVDDPVELGRGDQRRVELRFLRLDAEDFVQVLTLDDIKKRFPEQILRETWLLDMDLRPLIENALRTLIATPEADVPQLPVPAQNMWKLLNMTPKSTVLDGTSLAPLIGVGEAVGLGPAKILGDLLALDQNAPVITLEMTIDAVIEHVVGTHPNAKKRRGPITDQHPDGLYDVTPGTLPVSMWDVVTDFAELPKAFGPVAPHPGFIAGDFKFKATTDAFKMTVKVDLNALPYKGVDLTDGTVASVNSTKSQILDAFDFTTDDWMSIEGLVPALVVEEMTMAIYENPLFVASGTEQDPAPLGDSPVWELPPWQFERLIAELAVVKASDIPAHCTTYNLPNETDPPYEAVHACIGQGALDGQGNYDPDAPAPASWTSIDVDDAFVLDEPPPPPSYFWDILLEVAQVRLHDGGLKEGEGDIGFTLKNVPVGMTVAELVGAIKDNIQKDPAALSAIAELLNENTEGAADFFYYVAKPSNPADVQGDYLYYLHRDDIENDVAGKPVREYKKYTRPGFFSDPGLSTKVSSLAPLDGDIKHEKVKIAPGDVLYMQDDEGALFKITVGDKPSAHRIVLDLERVK